MRGRGKFSNIREEEIQKILKKMRSGKVVMFTVEYLKGVGTWGDYLVFFLFSLSPTSAQIALVRVFLFFAFLISLFS